MLGGELSLALGRLAEDSRGRTPGIGQDPSALEHDRTRLGDFDRERRAQALHNLVELAPVHAHAPAQRHRLGAADEIVQLVDHCEDVHRRSRDATHVQPTSLRDHAPRCRRPSPSTATFSAGGLVAVAP
jgi:hypothetical protein